MTRAAQAALRPEIPARTKARRGSYASASQPASGPPIGVEPRKTIEKRAITRPRISAETASWIVELTEETKITAAAPSAARVTASRIRLGIAAESRAATPKASEAVAITLEPVLPWLPLISAAMIEPTPIEQTSTA